MNAVRVDVVPYTQSYWMLGHPVRTSPRLEGEHDAGVVVVGGADGAPTGPPGAGPALPFLSQTQRPHHATCLRELVACPSRCPEENMKTSPWSVVTLCLVLGACGSMSTPTPGPAEAPAPADDGKMTEIGPGEGAVSIVAWAGYIERGETDKKFDWVTSFQEKTAARSASRPQRRRTRWSRS